MNRRPLYIETQIKCDFDTLWAYTQNPDIHQQWDLRFSEIKYLPTENEIAPQTFLYSTQIGFGIKVDGVGESVATRMRDNGESTSVLKFSSGSGISIIKQGSGYWKYVPETGGIKFFTGYDYQTRWGFFGEAVDKFVFRPMMVWATAWSFDRLKNWIEKGIHPAQAFNAQATVWLAAFILSMVWIYQGIVPKLLFPGTGEVQMLAQTGLFKGNEQTMVAVMGVGEVIFGLALLMIYRRWVHWLNIVALTALGLGVLISNPAVFTFPFNPFSLSVCMIVLSVVVIFNLDTIPKASNCITTQK